MRCDRASKAPDRSPTQNTHNTQRNARPFAVPRSPTERVGGCGGACGLVFCIFFFFIPYTAYTLYVVNTPHHAARDRPNEAQRNFGFGPEKFDFGRGKATISWWQQQQQRVGRRARARTDFVFPTAKPPLCRAADRPRSAYGHRSHARRSTTNHRPAIASAQPLHDAATQRHAHA